MRVFKVNFMMTTSNQITRTVFLIASQYRMKKSVSETDRTILGKTAQTLFLFVVLAALPYLIPGLERYRVLIPSTLISIFRRPAEMPSESAPSTIAQSAQPQTEIINQIESDKQAVEESVPGQIEDPSGHALDKFFSSLSKLESDKGGRVRVSHYGDSPITNDGITSTVRQLMQLRFGDGGHGFFLIDKPWGWYGHQGITHEASEGWKSNPIFISKGDHLYGFGGASFTSSVAGATASFGTTKEGKIGHAVSSFDIYFISQPGGGDFDVEVDGAQYGRVSTASDEIRSGFYQVKVEEGAHMMTIRTVGNGEVRLFGVTLESSSRGVEYDSLGVNGAFVGLLAHYIDEKHWTDQLRHRSPDLVIVGYGANESEFESLPMDQYERDTKEVIRRIRTALPNASVMLIGPMDRGKRGAGGSIVTRPMIKKLTEYQRRIAAETGSAFFDTFTAMGGEGTVARWYESRPKLMGGDFTHPTAQGAEIVGTLIYDAIINAYEKNKEKK
jgi:lysophospholipase L1-like esterase